jgi:hypothetical protein
MRWEPVHSQNFLGCPDVGRHVLELDPHQQGKYGDRISRIERLSDYPRLCERIRVLVQAGSSTSQITAYLAHEGFRSPKQSKPFSRQSVVELRRRLEVHHPRRRRRPSLKEHEWWLSDLACAVGVSHSTLHRWRPCGWLQARWHAHSKRWVAWADEARAAAP